MKCLSRVNSISHIINIRKKQKSIKNRGEKYV